MHSCWIVLVLVFKKQLADTKPCASATLLVNWQFSYNYYDSFVWIGNSICPMLKLRLSNEIFNEMWILLVRFIPILVLGPKYPNYNSITKSFFLDSKINFAKTICIACFWFRIVCLAATACKIPRSEVSSLMQLKKYCNDNDFLLSVLLHTVQFKPRILLDFKIWFNTMIPVLKLCITVRA